MPTPLPRVSYRLMTRADFDWEDLGSSRARAAPGARRSRAAAARATHRRPAVSFAPPRHAAPLRSRLGLGHYMKKSVVRKPKPKAKPKLYEKAPEANPAKEKGVTL